MYLCAAVLERSVQIRSSLFFTPLVTMSNLYVSSLAWATTDDTLRAHFETVGAVKSASVIKDKMSGRSKGFGFVEMESAADAAKAIETLNNSELDGRAIRVAEARPREDRAMAA